MLEVKKNYYYYYYYYYHYYYFNVTIIQTICMHSVRKQHRAQNVACELSET